MSKIEIIVKLMVGIKLRCLLSNNSILRLLPGFHREGHICVFSCFLKMAKDSAVLIEIWRSFHQLGTVQDKVCESDSVLLWDGTTRRHSLAERKLLEGA